MPVPVMIRYGPAALLFLSSAAHAQTTATGNGRVVLEEAVSTAALQQIQSAVQGAAAASESVNITTSVSTASSNETVAASVFQQSAEEGQAVTTTSLTNVLPAGELLDNAPILAAKAPGNIYPKIVIQFN